MITTTEEETKTKALTITPIVHLNGDSRETLGTQWRDFHQALRETLAKIPECHARNYYPLGEEKMETAREVQREISATIHTLEALAFYVRENITK